MCITITMILITRIIIIITMIRTSGVPASMSVIHGGIHIPGIGLIMVSDGAPGMDGTDGTVLDILTLTDGTHGTIIIMVIGMDTGMDITAITTTAMTITPITMDPGRHPAPIAEPLQVLLAKCMNER